MPKPQIGTEERWNKYRQWRWTALQKSAPNEAIQIIVSECYRRTLLYHRQCSTLARHPRAKKMYDVFGETYYWPCMASDVHEFVIKCKFCRRHGPFQNHQRWMQLFPPSEPLEFIAINILRPLTKQNKKTGSLMLWRIATASWHELSLYQRQQQCV